MRKLDIKGFTVVEMVAAVAITGILVVLIMTFLVNTIVNNSIRTAQADLLREAQLTLDLLARDVRLSANVDANNRWPDNNAPDAPTDLFSWESGQDTLILAIAAQNTAREVLFEDAVHYITLKNNSIFYLQNGALYRRILAANHPDNRSRTTCPGSAASSSCPADTKLINDVTDFSVRYYNNDNEEVEPENARSVELSLTLSQIKYGRSITAEYSTRTVFRNE